MAGGPGPDNGQTTMRVPRVPRIWGPGRDPDQSQLRSRVSPVSIPGPRFLLPTPYSLYQPSQGIHQFGSTLNSTFVCTALAGPKRSGEVVMD